jgi:hypothetical protein
LAQPATEVFKTASGKWKTLDAAVKQRYADVAKSNKVRLRLRATKQDSSET